MGKRRPPLEPLPVQTQNDIGLWMHDREVELADDVIIKLADAKGVPFTHITLGYLRQLVAYSEGVGEKRQPPTWEPTDG